MNGSSRTRAVSESTGVIDLSETGASVVFGCAALDYASVALAAEKLSSGWPASAVVSVQVSLDGIWWHPVPAGAVSFTALGIAHKIDVFAVAYARAVVTTATATADQLVRVQWWGEGVG